MKRRQLLSTTLFPLLPAATSAKENNLSDQVHENAALAIKQFQGRAKGTIDYSASSLELIEEMLDEAANHWSDLKPETSETLVELMGCYILEVGYREHGGKFAWYEKRKQPILVVGEPAFHIAMITFDKVRGRLSGDKADNIPFFYQGFSERAKMAEPGTNALYV